MVQAIEMLSEKSALATMYRRGCAFEICIRTSCLKSLRSLMFPEKKMNACRDVRPNNLSVWVTRRKLQEEGNPYEADTIFPMKTAPNVLSRSTGGARCRNMAANFASAAKQRDFISWCRANKRHPAIAAPDFGCLVSRAVFEVILVKGRRCMRTYVF